MRRLRLDEKANIFKVRPGRSAHQAVQQARAYVADGRRWVVDIDLEKFFDRVNHDVLMARVARKVKDKRVLGLIRRYLQAGMMQDGLVTARGTGTPQGGPPLLSNIMLDDLDKELERRGHAFCRYAVDRPCKRKFLGYSMIVDRQPRLKPAPSPQHLRCHGLPQPQTLTSGAWPFHAVLSLDNGLPNR